MITIMIIILKFILLSLGILTIFKLIPFLFASIFDYRKLAASSLDHLLILWTDNNGWLITFVLAFALFSPYSLVKTVISKPSPAAITYRTIYNSSPVIRESIMIFSSAAKGRRNFLPENIEIENYLSVQYIAAWWIFLIFLVLFTPWALKEEFAEIKEAGKEKKEQKREERKRQQALATQSGESGGKEASTASISNVLKDVIEGSFISEMIALPFKKLLGYVLHFGK